MKISHQGMFNDGGTPFALAAALKVAIAKQSTFAHYGKFATRTAVQGEVDLCGAAGLIVGVFSDVSPQGDSCTVETMGYVWVPAYAGVAVGDLVTSDAAGIAKKIAGAVVTLAELQAGVYQVDQVNGTQAQINLSARL